MKTQRILSIVLLCVLFVSCSDALYRHVPKADHHPGHASVPELRKRAPRQVIVPGKALQTAENNPAAPAKETAPTEAIASSIVPDQREVRVTEEDMEAIRVPVNEDTLEMDAEEKEQILYEAEESERISRKIGGWTIVTLVGYIFYPIYLAGIIGTLIYLHKFSKLTYVTETAIIRKRRGLIAFLIVALLPVLVAAALLIFLYLVF